ncbi:YbaB/EbfC family nucleoid-associated protein [Candidatus Peregrinibacteria bacterium]|nr:YbaB/EbfC family nucleoid-associated protein [Candidatus Peregrinibacteria bacterium]
MGFLDKAKDLYHIQKQAKVIEKQLKGITIEATSNNVTLVCDGKQLFLEAKGTEQAPLDPKLAKSFVEAANKAVKKSQEIGAERMKSVMGGMFGGNKPDLYTLQKQAKEIKEQLKNIHIEADSGAVVLTCNGEQEFIEVKGTDAIPMDPSLAKSFLDAANKAIKKSQLVGAEKMKEAMGGAEGIGAMFGQQ